MPSAIKAIFGADSRPFQAELIKIQLASERAAARISRVTNNSLGARLAGLFSVAAVSKITRDTVDWASKLRDSADALGVNVELLQQMQNGARLAGGSIEDLTKFITEMNRSREDAFRNPSGKNAAAFGRMGFSGSDISGLSTQDFFTKIVAAFKNGATAQLTNDVQEVGGRSARNLIAAFSSQFASDAPVLAEQLIDQLDDIGDAFVELKTTLMVDVAPAIIGVANALAASLNSVKRVGSFFGGFVGGVNKAEVKEGLRQNLLNIAVAGPATPFAIARAILGNSASGGQAMIEEEDRQKSQASSISAGRAAARKARRRRENSPPMFEPLPIKAASDSAGRSNGGGSYTPEITSNQRIGAFIGGPGIGLLDVNRQILSEHRETNKLLREGRSRVGPQKLGGFKTS